MKKPGISTRASVATVGGPKVAAPARSAAAKPVARRPASSFDANDFPTLAAPRASERPRIEAAAADEPVPLPLTGPAVDGGNGDAPVWLSVEVMKVWEGNPRHYIDPAELESLASSIEAMGQQEPVHVVPDPERSGHYLILAGQRRWLAIRGRNLQEGQVLTRVRTDLVTREAMLAVAIATQANTAPLLDIDFAISLARSRDEAGVREVARALGKSAGEVSKLRQVGELPHAVLEMLKRGAEKFSSAFAYEVALVNSSLGEEQAVAFANEVLVRDHSYKRTQARREELLGMRLRQTRRAWNTQRLQVNGESAGVLKTREDTGEVSLTVKRLSADQVERLREAIRGVIGEGSGASL